MESQRATNAVLHTRSPDVPEDMHEVCIPFEKTLQRSKPGSQVPVRFFFLLWLQLRILLLWFTRQKSGRFAAKIFLHLVFLATAACHMLPAFVQCTATGTASPALPQGF